MIINREGQVLALERAGLAGAWQLPQGGLEGGEEPRQAVLREIAEETGIPKTALRLIGSCPEPLAYELPPSARSEKTGRGQVQYWFLFELDDSDDVINVARGGEFGAWRWMFFDQVLAGVVGFRKPVYQRLASCFQDHLAPGKRSAI